MIEIDPMTKSAPQQLTGVPTVTPVVVPAALRENNQTQPPSFYQVLFDHLREGIIFVDSQLQVMSWSRHVEQVTGIAAASVIGKPLQPDVFQLRDVDGSPMEAGANPFRDWFMANQPTQSQFLITGRSGREAQCEFSYFPVRNEAGQPMGGVLILIDRSVQVELQRQLDHLYSQTVVDPLTQIANRAEFERLMVDYVQTHIEVGFKCSVIVCDLDYFKKINDHFGHHVGDQALIAFSGLLKTFVRSQDFVARYGGEEFVILCANCDERAAIERAEEIRQALESTSQAALGGKTMTASFGVAELQAGDTARTLFVRADQALLRAKESGRNRVLAASSMVASNEEPSATPEGKPETKPSETWPVCRFPQTPLQDEIFATNCPPSFLMRKVATFCQQFAIGTPKVSESWVNFVTSDTLTSKPGGGTFRVCIEVAPLDRLPSGMQAPDHAMALMRIAIMPARTGWFRRLKPEQARSFLLELRGFFSLIGPESEVIKTEAVSELGSSDRYQSTSDR